MSHRMYSIELRVDLKNDAKFEPLETFLRKQARGLYGFANMLKDHQDPQITVYSHDNDRGHTDIPIITEADKVMEAENPNLTDDTKALNEELLGAFK